MATTPRQLEGKIALVTGAARRVGRSIALRLAELGASVAIHYGTSKTEALATAKVCGGKAFQADLTNVTEIERLFDEVESSLGPLDLFVNNAARYREINVLEVTEQDWDFIHDVNLKAAFFCCQEAAKRMECRGGRIVILSSLGAIRPWTQHAPYCASKAGVAMLTRVLAKALAPEITVNSVAPGVIHFGDDIPPKIERLIYATPLQRPGCGEDIAEAVCGFLTGPSFITGQILAVDGGLSQRA